jgi:penicillin-binding protein 2
MSKGIVSFNTDFASPNRYKIFVVLLFGTALLFIGRLVKLQLLDFSRYSQKAQTQAIKSLEIEPFRGKFYDRNGILFLHNSPSFAVTVTKKDFDPKAMPLLSNLLGMRPAQIDSIIDEYKSYRFMPIKIAKDVDFETLALIEEYKDYMPGVDIQTDFKRLYDFDGNMSHMLGYTKEITREELDKMPGYKPGDEIGKDGLELYYEDELAGDAGSKMIAVNKWGEKVYDYESGSKDIIPTNGFDLHLGIDMNLQKVAEHALEGKSGAVVAIDPRDGAVRVFVATPDYDPRKFSGRVSAAYYDSLVNDPGKPLSARAHKGAYPPGSAWKMLVATAALEEGIIDKDTKIHCAGGISYGGRFWKCMGYHGSIPVEIAIKKSCNSFFYTCGYKLGFDRLYWWGKEFNMGSDTGIDLPYEQSGVYYDRKTLAKRQTGTDKIFGGTAVNYGIGQGEIQVTPLQMAAYISAIASSGTYHEPHIVENVFNNKLNKMLPVDHKIRQIKNRDGKPVSQETWDIVRQGMWNVVNAPGGTGGRARLDSIEVAGKTSTAQNPFGLPHAWFTCFAPYDNPEIAMAVLVENVGGGSRNAAPVARQILDSYFNPEKVYEYVPSLKARRDSLMEHKQQFDQGNDTIESERLSLN